MDDILVWKATLSVSLKKFYFPKILEQAPLNIGLSNIWNLNTCSKWPLVKAILWDVLTIVPTMYRVADCFSFSYRDPSKPCTAVLNKKWMMYLEHFHFTQSNQHEYTEYGDNQVIASFSDTKEWKTQKMVMTRVISSFTNTKRVKSKFFHLSSHLGLL